MLRSILGAVVILLGLLAAWPRPVVHAEKPKALAPFRETIPDSSVAFSMVAIPGGSFTMGSPANEADRKPDEGPQVKVNIRPFWLGQHEVTWNEFELFQKEVGVEDREENVERRGKQADAVTGPTPPYVNKFYGHGESGFPAICMTHHCAWEYCRWLAKKTGKPYRLPLEAEWEYACRAGTTTPWFFGNDADKLDEYAWTAKNSPDADHPRGTTHRVGQLKPNPWGLHDIAGNVMEWTIDFYEPEAYARIAKLDPALAPAILRPERKWSHVARGGNWSDNADACRSAARRPSQPSWMKHDPQEPQSIWWLTKFDIIGFRVALPADDYPNLKNVRSLVIEETDE